MLLGNGSVLHKSPLKFTGGSTVSVEQGLNSNFGKSGFSRNIMYVSERTTVFRYWATPSYNNAGSAWLIPQSVGEISSRNNAILSVNGSGAILGGVTANATASFTIDFAAATGALVAFGTGTSTISINTNSPLLTASVNGVGSASFTIDGLTSLLGAVVNGGGSSTISFTSSATILPTTDTSPLRTAAATFTLSGALTPYAIGSMVGSTANATVLTAEAVAFEVWNALSADFNLIGTMGRKLNTAASGGVDNTDVLTAVAAVPAAVLLAAQAAPIHADTQKINGADVVGNGSESDQWRGAGV